MNEKKIALITDSASDITEELRQRYSISLLPLRVSFGSRTYRDRVELTGAQLYEMMEAEPPKSSLPAGEDISGLLNRLRQEGYTDVLYLGMSSGLSGTFDFVSMMGREYEGLNFHATDTKTLSCGEGLLVTAAAQALENNGSVESAQRAVDDIRARMRAYFVVRTLTHLRRGGRIGKVEGTVGALLRVSPVISVNRDGVYETAAKTIGFTRAIDAMIKELRAQFAGKRIVLSVVHGMAEEEAQQAIEKIRSFCDVAQCTLAPVTAALGAHTGPGLVGAAAYSVQ